MLQTASLQYDLPSDLIATRPAEPRDSARLMVLRRSDPAHVEHRRFSDLPEFLTPADRLVFNTSWVVPARFDGFRADTSGKIEGLFLTTLEPGVWEVMIQSGSRLTQGMILRLHGRDRVPSRYSLRLDRKTSDGWRVELRQGPELERVTTDAAEILSQIGATPIPPYIRSARRNSTEHVSDDQDRRWYQAVYANPQTRGSVAAPTAGLHFTSDLLDRLSALGVSRTEVALHVGPGTFKPIQTEYVEQHPMHAEWCRVSAAAVDSIEITRAAGGRIIPVGTTSVRTLESLPNPITDAIRREGFAAATRLLITPGYQFRWTDALITNFHLPGSTLLALVAALFPEGVPRLLDHYRQAVRERYRFYSYGDAMLILP
ncbi:MAG: tRNA preQ1(34) S-adenosylmethionine ribosyltransferase-isomerase QueA [Phycisphaerae bacterium]|nr:tRNA preQ1(34) S-adenosylmethionine ribosyltransferase-isomerase QueA [Phycisphaerae bacterium]